MDDKNLFRTALAVAVIGFIGVVVAAYLVEPVRVGIEDIDSGMVGQNVVVNGSVKAISISEGNIFITLEKNGYEIKVVMFERTARDTIAYTLREKDAVSVYGKVNFYREDVEIIADAVARI